jgi:hypothetical protein
MISRFKKPFSAFLLFTLIFNWGGPLAVHQLLVFKADRFYAMQTDRGFYNPDDLTEVKIAANLPGVTYDSGYIRMFGEVKFGDASYNYVKMKLTRNAVYLLCVPNYETTHLCGQNIIHAENINDVPVPKKEHVPFGKSSILAHFDYVFQKVQFSEPIKTIPVFLTKNDHSKIDFPLDIPQPPPKATSTFLS